MSILTQKADILRVLTQSKTVAVVGFHPDPTRPAHYVPEYLHQQGYRVLAVNPALVGRGERAFGQPVSATLVGLTEPVDVVNVFRRSDKVGEHLADILSMSPLPKVVWLQLGIQNDEVARLLSERGIDVIQNRCMLADHRQYL